VSSKIFTNIDNSDLNSSKLRSEQWIALPFPLSCSLSKSALTQIPAAAADNLFHGHHQNLVREGLKKKGGRNRRNDIEIFI
jgi:hypothetical protein